MRLMWGTVGLAIAVAAAARVALRRLPPHAAVCALLDEHNRAGGLLMASEQHELGAWRPRVAAPRVPTLRFQSSRAWAMLLAAMTFVILGFALPPQLIPPINAPLDISADVEQLEQQIETLEVEELIEQSEVKQLLERLQQTADEATGSDPAKTWEAIDHLRDRVERAAKEGAQNALQETQRIADAQTLAQGLTEGGDTLANKLLTLAMSDLRGLLRQAAAENEALAQNLPQSLLEALQGAQLNPEALQQIARALNLANVDILKQVEHLVNANLIDARMLRQCEKAGQCNSEGLCQMLAAMGNTLSVCEIAGLCRRRGGWGINRGRGDAPMIWKVESNENDTIFKEVVLPPASVSALRQSQLQ